MIESKKNTPYIRNREDRAMPLTCEYHKGVGLSLAIMEYSHSSNFAKSVTVIIYDGERKVMKGTLENIFKWVDKKKYWNRYARKVEWYYDHYVMYY